MNRIFQFSQRISQNAVFIQNRGMAKKAAGGKGAGKVKKVIRAKHPNLQRNLLKNQCLVFRF